MFFIVFRKVCFRRIHKEVSEKWLFASSNLSVRPSPLLPSLGFAWVLCRGFSNTFVETFACWLKSDKNIARTLYIKISASMFRRLYGTFSKSGRARILGNSWRSKHKILHRISRYKEGEVVISFGHTVDLTKVQRETNVCCLCNVERNI